MQPDLGKPLSKASNGGLRIGKETRRFDLNGLHDRDEKPVLNLSLTLQKTLKPDPMGTLPKPCNAGLIDIEWVIEDLTKSEVQQSWWNEVFRIRRFRLPAPMLR